jgi:tRNA threonylcarbamoyladenosine modification (KEOPS) complex  Pcc1 subunit
MTNKPGNWAKALGERYSAINNVLHFWYNRNGDVMYGVNGEDIGIFFTGKLSALRALDLSELKATLSPWISWNCIGQSVVSPVKSALSPTIEK